MNDALKTEKSAMRFRLLDSRVLGLTMLLALGAFHAMLFAQGTGNNGGNNTVVNPQAGVVIDAQGVLQVRTFPDPGGMLTRERMAAAKAALGAKVAQRSPLRKISLNRLEAALRAHNGALSDEMRNLAGLQRLRYVFFYPDTKDVVIAGPAEGWMNDVSGRTVGITTRRPTLQLEDLVVALRAFPPSGKPTQLIGCSIDPTKEGLAAMQQFLRDFGHYANPSQTTQIVEGLRTSQGMHDVTINGVSPRTHLAQVLVEADYRMKLIGIGLEVPPVRLVSYVDRASPSAVNRSALERWYFVPDYKCVRVASDENAMELVGDGVKLVGEGEQVTHGGQRQSGHSSRASQGWVLDFTRRYPELAERSPIFAQLRNIIDLAVAAAFMQERDYYGKADWQAGLFLDEKQFATETREAPRKVSPAVNAIWKGSKLMTPIGGGVVIETTEALENENLLRDDGEKVSKLREQTKVELPAGQWWWD